MAAVSAPESPIDRALSLLLTGDHAAALRHAAALLESEPANPVALLVSSRLIAELGRRAPAKDGLEAAVSRAIDAGNLPLAVAACLELRALGAESSEGFGDIAQAFSDGSSRLLERGVVPPDLPGPPHAFAPLAASFSGTALLDQAESILANASSLLDRDRADPTPKVSPHPLFSALDTDGLRSMIAIFDVVTVPAGEVLIEQGTAGAEAYIVARGELEVRRNAMLLARLGNGALFGEMALLSRAPRAASVIAVRPSILLVARRDALEQVAAEQPQVGAVFADHCRNRMVENLVRTSSILSAVKESERPSLVERFVTRSYEEGERVIVQGEESEGLHLIASGEVAVVHVEEGEQTMIANLGAGEVVGEVALILRRPAGADVIAACPTVTLHLPRERFLDLIKEHPAILAQLYELAIKREEETSSIVAQEATEVLDYVLI
jgi:CRP-like cAMP-binding protein